ncbi:hypothetical protein [Candidatus Cyanaurora vandensis]|uniref:hypothetical protein n=1 Tax=Candidatus Cyanaurora vandensis TaxID=2714958 RepID=UPI00257FD5C8|nr:hypothetical protein [Candidatus Cyanaurora vandensis]
MLKYLVGLVLCLVGTVQAQVVLPNLDDYALNRTSPYQPPVSLEPGPNRLSLRVQTVSVIILRAEERITIPVEGRFHGQDLEPGQLNGLWVPLGPTLGRLVFDELRTASGTFAVIAQTDLPIPNTRPMPVLEGGVQGGRVRQTGLTRYFEGKSASPYALGTSYGSSSGYGSNIFTDPQSRLSQARAIAQELATRQESVRTWTLPSLYPGQTLIVTFTEAP